MKLPPEHPTRYALCWPTSATFTVPLVGILIGDPSARLTMSNPLYDGQRDRDRFLFLTLDGCPETVYAEVPVRNHSLGASELCRVRFIEGDLS